MSGYSTGTNNQLASDGVYNFTYDDEGNRLTRTKISNGKIEAYTWDHRNRLTKITFKNSDQTVTKEVYQRYDVFNRWVYRCVEPNASSEIDTFFSYEDGQVVLQFDEGGAAADLGHRYLWNPSVVDQLLADEQVTSLTSAGTVLWPLGDHLGTLRDLATYNTSTDDTAVANHRRYDSYGKLISETNAAVDEIFGFTGRALDESTGLQNNLNRWYDSQVGRWISEDPIGFNAADPNLARYVGNQATNSNDPSGLLSPSEFWDTWTDEQRRTWFAGFIRQYGEFIYAAAKKHCVPAELLAAVIANEMIDYTWYENLGEQMGIGKSLGPAQIHVNLAFKYNLYPVTLADMLRKRGLDPSRTWEWDEVDWGIFQKVLTDYYSLVRVYLNNPETGIDAAGRLMSIYLDELRDHVYAPGPWGGSPPPYGMLPDDFVRKIAGLSSISLVEFKAQITRKGKPCSQVVSLDVSVSLMRAMQALFNDGISVIKPGGFNRNVRRHVVNMEGLDDIFLPPYRKPIPDIRRPRPR